MPALRSLPGAVPRWLVPAVIALLVVAAGIAVLTPGGGDRTLVAHFPRTVSVYEGTSVRVLGVPIGKVDDVRPNGTDVAVTMHYDSDVKIPADAKAVIVSPSIVGDRYIQLTPAYGAKAPTGEALPGETTVAKASTKVLPDNATLPVGRTAVPLELDDVYSSLDQLVVALGPTGANKQGALTDLLEQTAKNFGGQGSQFKQTIEDLGQLSSTLDDNKDELFGSAAELEKFVSTLAENDGTVRQFAQSLAQVSSMLEGERTELSSSLRNLSVALGDVETFVKTNKSALTKDIAGLNRVTGVLVRRRDELSQTLDNAPLALNNLYLTYNPDTGTLDTNANLSEMGRQIQNDPSLLLCTITNQADKSGQLCNLLDQALPRATVFGAGTGSSVGINSDPTLGGLVRSKR